MPWIKPLHLQEPLSDYTERMAAAIIPNRPGIIAGVSFGGMAAVEIAAKRPWLKPVEISSISEPKFLPWHLRLVKASGIYKVAPMGMLKFFPRIGAWYFGTKGNTEYQLFKEILDITDPFYLRWAVNQLLNWNPACPGNCAQIIGTNDTIFPPGCCPGAIRIKGGTHLMVYSEAEKISTILNEMAREWLNEQKLAAGR